MEPLRPLIIKKQMAIIKIGHIHHKENSVTSGKAGGLFVNRSKRL